METLASIAVRGLQKGEMKECDLRENIVRIWMMLVIVGILVIMGVDIVRTWMILVLSLR